MCVCDVCVTRALEQHRKFHSYQRQSHVESVRFVSLEEMEMIFLRVKIQFGEMVCHLSLSLSGHSLSKSFEQEKAKLVMIAGKSYRIIITTR